MLAGGTTCTSSIAGQVAPRRSLLNPAARLCLAVLAAEPKCLDEEPKNSVSLSRMEPQAGLCGTVGLPGSPNTRPHSRIVLAAGVAARLVLR